VKKILLIVLVLSFFVILPGVFAQDWWNLFWGGRKNIVISYSGPTKNDVTLDFNITYDVGMNLDFTDVRFVDSDGTELNFWKDPSLCIDSSWCYFSVGKMMLNGDKNITMYYGNSQAKSDLSDCNSTFIWCDDFSTNTSSEWIKAGSEYAYCAYEWFPGYMRFYIRYEGQQPPLGVSKCFNYRTTHVWNQTDVEAWMERRIKTIGSGTAMGHNPELQRNNGIIVGVQYHTGSDKISLLGGPVNVLCTYSDKAQVDTWYRSRSVQLQNKTMYGQFLNDNYTEICGYPNPLNTSSDEVGNLVRDLASQILFTDGYSSAYFYYDYMRVRKFLDPEPTYSIGSAEVDRDDDGLPNWEDACPDIYGKYCNGCPVPLCEKCKIPNCPSTGEPYCIEVAWMCDLVNQTESNTERIGALETLVNAILNQLQEIKDVICSVHPLEGIAFCPTTTTTSSTITTSTTTSTITSTTSSSTTTTRISTTTTSPSTTTTTGGGGGGGRPVMT